VHLNLQLVTHACTAIGVLVPFCFLIDQSTFTHLSNLHAWLGLIVAITTVFVQPLLGTLDQEKSREDNQRSLRQHGYLGRSVFVLAFATMYLGLQLIKDTVLKDFHNIVMYFWVWTVFVLMTFFLLELRKLFVPKRIKQKSLT
jgi:undecaprenyl pyrophosphate phosphatase UppP